MANYFLTNKAVEDLADIWDYTIEKWSEKQANSYYQIILNSFQKIATTPQVGKNYENVSSDLLGLKVRRHVVFYREQTNQTVEITRILHEQMDLKNRLI